MLVTQSPNKIEGPLDLGGALQEKRVRHRLYRYPPRPLLSHQERDQLVLLFCLSSAALGVGLASESPPLGLIARQENRLRRVQYVRSSRMAQYPQSE